VVTRELQGSREVPVPQRPVSVQIVEVALPVLQIDLDRLGSVFRLANQSRIGPAPANIREAADVTEDLAELIGLGRLPEQGAATTIDFACEEV